MEGMRPFPFAPYELCRGSSRSTVKATPPPPVFNAVALEDDEATLASERRVQRQPAAARPTCEICLQPDRQTWGQALSRAQKSWYCTQQNFVKYLEYFTKFRPRVDIFSEAKPRKIWNPRTYFSRRSREKYWNWVKYDKYFTKILLRPIFYFRNTFCLPCLVPRYFTKFPEIKLVFRHSSSVW